METYPINLTPGNGGAYQIPATGDLFVYESATTAGDVRIRVKPDTGGEIILKPGQRFRTPERTTMWTIRLVGTDPVAGFLIIGEGDFDDANTLNKVTLDAQFANNVTVMNSAANRVPVSLDPNQLLQQAGPILAYTNSVKAALLANAVTQVIAPSVNVNGIIIEKQIFVNGNSVYSQAKAAMPTGADDGDVLAFGLITERIKIAPGKGVFCYASGTANTTYMLYTVL